MTIAHVLLVDDEVPFVEAITRRLVKRGLDVVTAYSGAEAMALLEEKPLIEVVILDVKMPAMDGIDTLREIKRRHPLVEVIMLTGHGTIESAIDGMKFGAFDYLMKPSDMDILLEKVQQAASRKRAQEDKILEARMKEITSRRI